MAERSARNDALTQSTQPGRSHPPQSGSHAVVSKRPANREQASVQAYFDRFADAMTAGDLKTMVKLWGVPAFVLGKSEARVVQSESEVEQFFAGSKEMYNERGITRTYAEIIDLDWVDRDLVIATVRWPYLDDQENVLGEESSSYTLFRGEDGSFKLRSVLMRGSRAPEDGTDGE
jgi:hypothetical protein